ncbi:hypothetical protein DM01DRAFT_113159 [Hesseltinella vesiculosa]|uniref:Uncharacterized protein n=1 Tax=Hesseltinella vesiculosa TaxID=101127 RepID=A0A1X2GRA8_9FUNG|nr:hypothetical protein DM01DRAFT_113159 [Hesseltinella vesiculosa]
MRCIFASVLFLTACATVHSVPVEVDLTSVESNTKLEKTADLATEQRRTGTQAEASIPFINFDLLKHIVPYQILEGGGHETSEYPVTEDIDPEDEEQLLQLWAASPDRVKKSSTGAGYYQHKPANHVKDMPIMVVPIVRPNAPHKKMVQPGNVPTRLQRTMVGMDDQGNIRHLVLDSAAEAVNHHASDGVAEKHFVAVDEAGQIYALSLPVHDH